MTLSLAVWGILTGWLIMPRSKNSEVVLAAHGAYILAITSGFAIAGFWLVSSHAILFLLGMSSQYVVYLLARGCKYVFKKIFNTRGM